MELQHHKSCNYDIIHACVCVCVFENAVAAVMANALL